MYQIHGERRQKWTGIIDKFEARGWLEDVVSAWSSPSFPVPKKKPGDYRLVVDYRAVNAATITDAHPVPRIDDILQQQGKFRIWSVLDMKDGYHQVPLRKEERHITCMSTQQGTKQWTVLVMSLKNAGAIFQRMMEGVLKGVKGVNVYVDDVIIGLKGRTKEELLANKARNLLTCLERLKQHDLHDDFEKPASSWKRWRFAATSWRMGDAGLHQANCSPSRSGAAPESSAISADSWGLPTTIVVASHTTPNSPRRSLQS
jgi:hypothetical protein